MSDTDREQTIAEIAALRARVAFHKRQGEFYRRRGLRFLKERDEARRRVATLEDDIREHKHNEEGNDRE